MISILYYLFFLIFTQLYLIPFALLFAVTVLFDKERVALHWASRFWALSVFYFCPAWRLCVEGRKKVSGKGPFVVITNHQSMLDVPLMYVLPLNFKWVAKKEVLSMPIFGWVLRMHGDIAIERGSSQSARQMMHKATDILNRGTSVIMFPEGTRTKDGSVGRFKEGAFVLAQSAGMGILPVAIEGTRSANRGWRLQMPHRFSVRILDPISAEEVAATPTRELAEKLQQQISKAQQELTQQ